MYTYMYIYIHVYVYTCSTRSATRTTYADEVYGTDAVTFGSTVLWIQSASML